MEILMKIENGNVQNNQDVFTDEAFGKVVRDLKRKKDIPILYGFNRNKILGFVTKIDMDKSGKFFIAEGIIGDNSQINNGFPDIVFDNYLIDQSTQLIADVRTFSLSIAHAVFNVRQYLKGYVKTKAKMKMED